MEPPQPVWDTIYAVDRRKHHHRCRCCNRILAAGEAVVMARVKGKKTYAVHAMCADKQHGTAEWTYRNWLHRLGTEYQRACGWRVALPSMPSAM